MELAAKVLRRFASRFLRRGLSFRSERLLAATIAQVVCTHELNSDNLLIAGLGSYRPQPGAYWKRLRLVLEFE